MPKLSIVVPIYNIENYITRCIDSIQKQSFDDFELLLIDDGSVDRSGYLCDAFAKKDNRIKVFHKNNAGVSSARNLGIENAKGDFIVFIDGDDWIHKNYLQELYNEVRQSDCDIVICGGREIDENGDVLKESSYLEKRILQWDDPQLYDWPYFTYVIHRMIIRKSIAQKVKFNILLTNGEDSLFLTESFVRAKKGICFIPYTGYFYFIHDQGAAQHYKYSRKKFSSIIAYEKRLQIMEQSGIPMQLSWFYSFVLEVYRLYSYILWHPEFYCVEHTNILFDYLKKYKKYADVLGSGLKFKLMFNIMLRNQNILEKQLKRKKLPVPHIMEN